MIRICTVIFISLLLSAQWVLGAIQVENTDLLVEALNGTNFQRLTFETPANNLKFATTKGETIDLRQLHGRVVILTFWTISDPKWPAEIRSLETLLDKYGVHGLEIIALNLVDPIEKIKMFLSLNPTNLCIAFDADNSLSVSRRKFVGDTFTSFVTDRNSVAIYEIPEYPTSYIIDRDGRVLGFFVGTTDWNAIRLENVFSSFSKRKNLELAQENGVFATDARQGIGASPQTPAVGPTKRGPLQAPLGPQAPEPVADDKPGPDVKSLPFQPTPEMSAEQPKRTNKSSPGASITTKSEPTPGSDTDVGATLPKARPKKKTGAGKASVGQTQVERIPTPYGSTSADPFVTSRGRPALPLSGSGRQQQQNVGGSSETPAKKQGPLPAAKPYYPSQTSPAPVQTDSSGRVLATIPGSGGNTPGPHPDFPRTGSSDLPAAQPLPNRNLIGGSILDSFGDSQKTARGTQSPTSKDTEAQNQPANVFEQIGQDVWALGEGIRGAFSKVLGSR